MRFGQRWTEQRDEDDTPLAEAWSNPRWYIRQRRASAACWLFGHPSIPYGDDLNRIRYRCSRCYAEWTRKGRNARVAEAMRAAIRDEFPEFVSLTFSAKALNGPGWVARFAFPIASVVPPEGFWPRWKKVFGYQVPVLTLAFDNTNAGPGIAGDLTSGPAVPWMYTDDLERVEAIAYSVDSFTVDRG